MYVLLSTIKPRSVRAASEKLKLGLRHAFSLAHPTGAPLSGDLYAAVYYFHRVPTELDADNLSKPVLDALEGLAYENDKQVKVRYSGIFDLRSGTGVLDVDRVPQPHRQHLLGLLASQKNHVLYVEVGRLHYEQHFRFGSEVLP